MRKRAVAYCRVSSREQELDGASLDAQEQTCRNRANLKKWDLQLIVREQASTIAGQPERDALLERMDAGEFDVLVVSRQDRLARSPAQTYDIMDRASKNRWELVILDPEVDMSTPMGRAMAGMAAVFAQFERDMISARTREAIAQRKRDGTYRGYDRPQSQPVDEEAVEEILRLHRKRNPNKPTAPQIARMLDALSIPTPRGGPRWSPTTVRMVILRECGTCTECTRMKREARERKRLKKIGAR